MNARLTESQQTDSGGVSAAAFRAVSALFPSGVTVITRRMGNGRPHGMTVSSFTSVSLDPPMILVCIDRSARFADGMVQGLPFHVNVLSEDQEHIARRFADRRETDRFSQVNWIPGWADTPRLCGTVATFACLLDQIVEAGDHLVLIAKVQELLRHEGRALVWCERGYHCLPRPE